jgi:hypothetical protein
MLGATVANFLIPERQRILYRSGAAHAGRPGKRRTVPGLIRTSACRSVSFDVRVQ